MRFIDNVKKGKLDQVTFLQPRMTSHNGPPTWQHPDALVSAGEHLYKQIYETLRNSPFWNKLAFIITYDEHGGFYDHVSPPQDGIPNPDNINANNGFKFDRLGVRVPTIVISPWVKKGTVVHRPTGPTSTSQFDSTSIMATINKIFNIKENMLKRAEWAGTFEHIFNQMDAPRDDCPISLPDIPETSDETLKIIKEQTLNDHFKNQSDFFCKFNNRDKDCGKDIKNQYQASVFIEKEAKYFMDNLKKINV